MLSVFSLRINFVVEDFFRKLFDNPIFSRGKTFNEIFSFQE